jgi:hypothetical protein
MGWDYVSELLPLTDMLFIPRMICEYGEGSWSDIDRENRRTRRKTCPSVTYPPQIPYGLTRVRTQDSAVGGRRLTVWSMARPWYRVWLRTGWRGDRGSIPGRGKTFYSPSGLWVQASSGAHPASCTMGSGGPFPGAKEQPGRDADHSGGVVINIWWRSVHCKTSVFTE